MGEKKVYGNKTWWVQCGSKVVLGIKGLLDLAEKPSTNGQSNKQISVMECDYVTNRKDHKTMSENNFS